MFLGRQAAMLICKNEIDWKQPADSINVLNNIHYHESRGIYMSYDPLEDIDDEPLAIDLTVMEKLRQFRWQSKLMNLPGTVATEERERLEPVLNQLVDRLLDGVERHPSKLWVLTQFQPALELVAEEDTEAREHFGIEIETIMDILGIESSDGLLSCYLGGI
jgi:hypothetical protein